MFLVDDVPYLIDKAERSTVYRFPRLDPEAVVTPGIFVDRVVEVAA